MESLFISFQPVTIGQKVSSAILGRWLRVTIAKAYEAEVLPVPRRLMAHSTRSASTSVTWATQTSLVEVCRAAAWVSPTPFIHHYKPDSYAFAGGSLWPLRTSTGIHETGPTGPGGSLSVGSLLWYVPFLIHAQ